MMCVNLHILGAAEVRTLNFSQWFGSGILHTKVWIVDKKHIYLGSANMDWRSLTQVRDAILCNVCVTCWIMV